MSFKKFRSFGKNFSRTFYNHTSNSLKLLNISILGLIITACSAGETGSTDIQTNTLDPDASLVAVTLEGSVGDGPTTGAQISIKDSQGALIGSTVSDSEASYSITIPEGVSFPVVIEATGGTDVVTGAEPDFTMLSVALNSSATTVNINPFSTMIVKTAQSMAGGLTAGNISLATQFVTEQLNFGLDSALVSNPVTTSITSANVAVIIKASEAFGETIRRTRSTLQVSGVNYSGDEIVDTLARDMTDGMIDGLGQGADVQVAAVSTIMSGQVLVESLVNQLSVNGADATSLMDLAINISVPSATMTTSDVAITESMLTQTRTAVAAAQTHTPSSNLSAIAVILAGLSGNSLAADLASVLPVDPSSVFNEVITQLPLSTDTQLESVNSVIISGAFQFAATDYTVGESDGSVDITINRVGGSAGTVNVEWRTSTFNGDGTADWANDYGTFLWTERTLTFADGETSKVEQISISEDALVEGDETFSVFIRTAAGDVVSTALVTILDETTPIPVPEPVPEPAPEPVPVPEPVPEPVPSDRPWEDLVNNIVGFGNKTTGGKGGDVCLVTSLSNSGSGTLRDCITRSDSQWIKFDRSGIINLTSIIFPTSNKTVDGRGQDITITGEGFDTETSTNLIFHNIKISGTNSDGIRIKRGSQNIWVDHVSFSNPGDEMLSIVSASTDVTISWSKFQGSGYGMLISSSADSTADSVIRVTLHHNHFEQVSERHPFVRHGKLHMFNNFIDSWGSYAVEARSNAQLLSENNIWKTSSTSRSNLGINSSPSAYDPLPAFSVVTKGEWLVNDVSFQTRNELGIFNPTDWYEYSNVLDSANSTLMSDIEANSGWQSVAAP